MDKFIQYFRESYAELLRVTWPTRSQTLQYSALVVAISISTAIFLGLLDYFFGISVTDVLLNTGSQEVAPINLEDLSVPIEIDSGAQEVPVEGLEDPATDDSEPALESTDVSAEGAQE